MNYKQTIKTIIKEKRVDVLAKFLFNVYLTEGQQEIVKSIVFPDYKRVHIETPTRYGKTFSTAVAICIYIYLHDNKKVLIVAPTADQSQLIRNEVAGLIVSSKEMQSLIDSNEADTRLKKEVSRKRITFRNRCSLTTLSAEGEANRLMGSGGDLIILDESSLIKTIVYKSKIHRMLADSPTSKLVELGNPWKLKNTGEHFFEHWKSDEFYKIKIDYLQGIKEGRITEEFIQEARETLDPLSFKVLYKVEFPDDSEDVLIQWKWIDNAKEQDFPKQGKIEYGLDPARQGKDLTVLKKVIKHEGKIKELYTWSWEHQDTMSTVGKVKSIVGDDLVKVDEIGLGGGIVDRMKEMKMNVKGVQVSQSPTREKHRFLNKKAQYYFNLRSKFEEGLIDIKDDKTCKELNQIKYEFSSNGKIRIIDPDKSPDYADALMLAVCDEVKGEIVFF
jgi:phage terminase large subunit